MHPNSPSEGARERFYLPGILQSPVSHWSKFIQGELSLCISGSHQSAPLAVAQETRPCSLAFQLSLVREARYSRPVAGEPQAGKPWGVGKHGVG